MTKTVAIIQARLSSGRLPGKVLKPILSQPLLSRMIERVKRAKLLNQIVIATTINPEDDSIARLTASLGISSFRGSPTDVLDRFLKTAKKYHADIIVRLTADCPLIDPALIDEVITVRRLHEADYASNRSLNRAFPSGMDAEALTFKALQIADRQATTKFDREHVTSHIYHHPRRFKLVAVPAPNYRLQRDWHLSVDGPKDLKLVRTVYRKLYRGQPNFNLSDIICLLEPKP